MMHTVHTTMVQNTMHISTVQNTKLYTITKYLQERSLLIVVCMISKISASSIVWTKPIMFLKSSTDDAWAWL